MVPALPNWFDHLPKTKLFLGAVVFRVFIALFFHQPGYTDAYYYSNIAESLWKGQGFQENYIWNYISRPISPQIAGNPSNLYWMPLTSILIYLAYLVSGGQSFLASQAPAILLSAGLAPIAYYLWEDFFERGDYRIRLYGWLSGTLAVFGGLYMPWFVLPDNFAPFAFLSASFLVCIHKALSLPPDQRQTIRNWMIGAGVLAGFAYLSRVDGVLLLIIVPITVFIYRVWLRQPSGLGWQAMGFMLLAFLIIISPWLLRELLVTGQLLPGGGTRTIFFRQYEDFFSYQKPLDLGYFLNQTDPSPDWGLGAIIGSKLGTLLDNLSTANRGAIFLGPLFLLGLWWRREPAQPKVWRNSHVLPFLVYGISLYLGMSLVFTFPSTHGSFFHSAGGFLPFIFFLSFLGMDRLIVWLCRNRPPAAIRSRQVFFSALILGFYLAVTVGYSLGNGGGWDDAYDQDRVVGIWLTIHSPQTTALLVPDPSEFWYANHISSMSLSSDPVEANIALAKQYGLHYIMLQDSHLPTSFQTLFFQKTAPGLKLILDQDAVELYEIVDA